MIVIIKLRHKREDRKTQLEIWGLNPLKISKIQNSGLPSGNRKILVDECVKEHVKSRIPPGYDQWDLVDWEFADPHQPKAHVA